MDECGAIVRDSGDVARALRMRVTTRHEIFDSMRIASDRAYDEKIKQTSE